MTALPPWLGADAIRAVWTDPELLRLGLSFSIPLLLILLCHELGHYLPCRRYGLRSTPPYFLPAPLALGTLGAFIRIRSPIPDRRRLLVIGAGGPIAGFAALLPFLLLGVLWSEPGGYVPVAEETATATLFRPGSSLLFAAVSLAVHGPLPEATTLNLHPFALAAWFGLLATALNLLPVAQLDGGHILYALVGRRQHALRWPIWGALAACGLLWPGWFLWCGLTLALGLKHPPVRDETAPLGPESRRLAWLALAILILSFMPIPIEALPVAH